MKNKNKPKKDNLYPIIGMFFVGAILGVILTCLYFADEINRKDSLIKTQEEMIGDFSCPPEKECKACSPVVCTCSEEINNDKTITRVPTNSYFYFNYDKPRRSYCEIVIGESVAGIKLYVEKNCGFEQVMSSTESVNSEESQIDCEGLRDKFLSVNIGYNITEIMECK